MVNSSHSQIITDNLLQPNIGLGLRFEGQLVTIVLGQVYEMNVILSFAPFAVWLGVSLFWSAIVWALNTVECI